MHPLRSPVKAGEGSVAPCMHDTQMKCTQVVVLQQAVLQWAWAEAPNRVAGATAEHT
jgi:hypothetical protein